MNFLVVLYNLVPVIIFTHPQFSQRVKFGWYSERSCPRCRRRLPMMVNRLLLPGGQVPATSNIPHQGFGHLERPPLKVIFVVGSSRTIFGTVNRRIIFCSRFCLIAIVRNGCQSIFWKIDGFCHAINTFRFHFETRTNWYHKVPNIFVSFYQIFFLELLELK